MAISRRSQLLLPLLYLCSLLTNAQQTNTPQQIFTLDAFSLQQTCVQSCFTFDLSGCTTDLVGSAIGCPINSCTLASGSFGALDSCYCRSDLQGAAESWLVSCVRELCTVGDTSVNAASATGIYLDYCGSKGYATAPVENNDAKTTPSITNPTSPSNPSSGSTAGPPGSPTGNPNSTGESNPPPTGDSSSSPSNTIYIVIGVIGGLLALSCLVAFIFIRKYRRSKRWQWQPPTPEPNGMGMGMQMGPYLNPSPPNQYYSGSAHPLRSDISAAGTGSNLSSRPGGRQEIYPEDSASSIGVGVGPSYPHNMEPSLISTRMY